MPRFFFITIIIATLACRASHFATNEAIVTELPTGVASFAFSTPETISSGNYTLSLANGSDQRDVVLHLPPAYDGSSQLPLVIVLHGGAGSGEQIQRLSEMDADADELGFVVAYPDGSGRLSERLFTWNGEHCCGFAFENNIDDVGFISLLIDNLLSHYAIDPDRVYITGISNGGIMAYRAGAELADKVAGIAPIAGTIGGQVNADGVVLLPPAPSSPVAVIAFHGMQDQHVLYGGGNGPMALIDGRIDISVADSIAFWVQANGCDPQPTTETQAGGNIIIETYSGCAGDASVVLVTIVDGGHAWPGAHKGLVSDLPTQDISANEMMLQFFLEHPKQSD